MAEIHYTTDLVRCGLGGVNLRSEIDALPPLEFLKLTNVSRVTTGGFTARAGQTTLATAGTNHHSVQRLNNPAASTFTRIWGVDTHLYIGQSGGLTDKGGGYSGNPLALVPAFPPFINDAWMYVGDSSQMNKIRADGVVMPIGLAPPGGAPATSLGLESKVVIEDFTAGFAGWGQTGANPAVPAYGPGKDGNCLLVALSTLPTPLLIGPFYAWCDKGIGPIDLTTFGGGLVATDDDFIHLWLQVDHPEFIVDIKVYLTVSAFTGGIIPGTNTASNTDAYVKSFTPSDIAGFVVQAQGPFSAAQTAAQQQQLAEGIRARPVGARQTGTAVLRNSLHNSLVGPPPALGPGAGQWTEFGVIAVPLRRGDFTRIGTNEAATWATVQGISIVVQTNQFAACVVKIDQMYMTGGYGLDSADPGDNPYDYRYTHYDPRTGVESNPSPIQASGAWLNSLRRLITVLPNPYGNGAIRQRVYRRGGTLNDDWYFLATNTADGAGYSDLLSDASIAAAGTVATDHDQPVTTVDSSGVTVLAQPTAGLFGPVQGILFACGDPYRPGHLYWSLASAADHWPAANNTPVCPGSEQLMNGVVYGGQAYVASRQKWYVVYPNLSGSGGVTTTPTGATRGLVGRWAFTVGPGGIYFVANDGLYRFTGGGEEPLTDEKLRPLFLGQTRNGYKPVDFTVEAALRLAVANNELWFQYQDTDGVRQVLILNLLDGTFRFAAFSKQPSVVYAEDLGTSQGQLVILGGKTTGKSYTNTGVSDDSTAIAAAIRTGFRDQSSPRNDKLYGDVVLELDRQSTTITVQTAINSDQSALGAQTITTGSGLVRYTLDPFGTSPQQARNVALEVSWSSAAQSPVVDLLGVSYIVQPDTTVGRITDWDDLGAATEKYLTGVELECDTGGVTKTILVQGTLYNGGVTTLATLTVNTATREKIIFTWAVQRATLVRLRPTDSAEWKLYGTSWIATPEPPRTAKWDSNWEDLGDTYYTGLTLDVDTFNLTKTVQVYVDQTLITTLSVTANGRHVFHYPFGSAAESYGHLYRFVATDANVGLLYGHTWHTAPQPREIANWDAEFEDAGEPGLKFFTGVLLECDTFGVAKTVEVLLDGTVVDTLTVTASGRTTLPFNFTGGPYYGYVMRLSPIDVHPGRLWKVQYLFTKEPEATTGFGLSPFTDLSVIGEKYLTGVILEVDTFNQPKEIDIVVDGSVVETLTISTNGRKLAQLNFPSGPYRTAGVVRVAPHDDTDVLPAKLYGANWLFDPEPADTVGLGVLNFSSLGVVGEKYLSGVVFEIDTHNQTKTLQVLVDSVVVDTLSVATAERQILQFALAGGPYRAASVVRLHPTDAQPGKLYNVSWLFEAEPPDTAAFGVLNFTDLSWVGEKYVTGIALEADTHGLPKTVTVEIDGAVVETLTVNTARRAVQQFYFPGGPYRSAKVLRLRPTDTNPGKLYGVQWYFENEPPDTAGMGVLNFSDLGWIGEKYISGIIVEADTHGVAKLLQVELDGVVVDTLTVTTTQRAVQQYSLAGGPYPAAKIVRLLPADAVPAKLYNLQWLFEAEPPDVPGLGVLNWSALDALGDKYIKGVILEIDTHGQTKTINIEADGGTVITSFTVATSGRQVFQHSFPQIQARVVRLRPTDAFPGKLYSKQWIFDQEPLALTYWETQLVDHGERNWYAELWAMVTIRCDADVIMTVARYFEDGATQVNQYRIVSTGGVKQKQRVGFYANKGVLTKYTFTSGAAFWLYREESWVTIQPWGADGARVVHPFGNDDLDPTRGMVNAVLGAARAGGSLQG